MIMPGHTVNSGSEIVGAKHVSGKNIYWSTCIGKTKERKIFDFLHCPFEPPAKQHRPVSQLGWILWCMLARPSKGQCRNSKIFPPLLLTVKVDQNIFSPETCFTSTISEPEFTVCISIIQQMLASRSLWSNKTSGCKKRLENRHFLRFLTFQVCTKTDKNNMKVLK